MANFSPAFSDSADKRYPSTDERNNGFDCGPADRELFNGLYHRIESELGYIISTAGLMPTDTDLTQVYQAIQAMIDAATGGSATENYLLMTQARARLPVYPELSTTDGTMTVTAPSTGTVRVPGGVTFMHRGIYPVTTTQTDFTTEASKTYHIRWNTTDGLIIKSLSDATYNASSLAETNSAFDSTYDDMLIARVVTNSSNVATITNLVNKNRLVYSYTRDYLLYPAGSLANSATSAAASETITYNLARTPVFFLNGVETSGLLSATATDAEEWNIYARSMTRYAASVFTFQYDASRGQGGRPKYAASFMAVV